MEGFFRNIHSSDKSEFVKKISENKPTKVGKAVPGFTQGPKPNQAHNLA
ncbi:hypothetical protein CLV95_11952 [Leptospira borgpetersenii serovar Javanica]|uniref:Uncharacterized protein n=1 Tax=Leptospira borgpetersenii serovar Ballum TaxID=280505 RepID=A0A0S2IY07_LEPBO|nr:hypothetical protein LBBP_02991 [Leptospira borgpetersenii serovar Ballum]ALO28540.1 hypothetical protein LBBP_04436 [Leptospira borgpetersenii serovar Ballum]APY25052.1 Uncharacterized protein LB4E_2350 [Leptospira borgpetersenii str. 4E]PTM43831.1 hypothetical protein CLV95_11952 [Leptospira borgpetersenii serovar Javanica]